MDDGTATRDLAADISMSRNSPRRIRVSGGGRWCASDPDNFCRYTYGCGTSGDIIKHNGISSDVDIGSNRDGSHDFGSSADKDAISKDRACPPLRAYRHLMFKIDMCPSSHLTVDHNAGRVDEYQTRAKLGSAADDAIATDHIQFIEE